MSRRCDLYRRHVPCLCNTVVIPVVRAVRVEAVVEEAAAAVTRWTRLA